MSILTNQLSIEPALGDSTYRSGHPSDVRTICSLLEEANLPM
jgi:hypothetical protein